MKPIQTYVAPGITVTFDPNLCIHSAVCLKSLPEVFDTRRRPWIRAEGATAAEVAAAIERCPSGALKYVLADSGAAAEAKQAPSEIRLSPNGPLLVQGAFTLLDEDGNALPVAGTAALCRCGMTANPPFCDGSHVKIGFSPKKGV